MSTPVHDHTHTHPASTDPEHNADTVWKSKPFNRAFALYMIVALAIAGLILGYYVFFAARQATPGVTGRLHAPVLPCEPRLTLASGTVDSPLSSIVPAPPLPLVSS